MLVAQKRPMVAATLAGAGIELLAISHISADRAQAVEADVEFAKRVAGILSAK